jgi:hypothetical protein
MHVMIGGPHRLLPSGYPVTRELADLHFGLGVQGDAERFRGLRGLRVDLPEVVEDGVGFRDFF